MEDENFRNTQTLIISTKGQTILQGEYLKVYLWNEHSSDAVIMTLNGAILRTPTETYLPATATNELVTNQLVSSTPENSTDTTRITEAIAAVVSALGKDDSLGISSTMSAVMNATNNAVEPDLITALEDIRITLTAFQEHLNQNTLDNLTQTITDNLQIVADFDPETYLKLQQSIINLNAIRETATTLRSSDSISLFPQRVYNNEEHTAILNLSGHDNIILIIAASSTLPAEIERVEPRPLFSGAYTSPLLRLPHNIDATSLAGFTRRIIDNTILLGDVFTHETVIDFMNPQHTNRRYDFGVPPPAYEVLDSGVCTTVDTLSNGRRTNRWEQRLNYTYEFDIIESADPLFFDFNEIANGLNPEEFFNPTWLGNSRYVKITQRITAVSLEWVVVTHNDYAANSNSPYFAGNCPLVNAYDFVDHEIKPAALNPVDLAVLGGYSELVGEVRDGAGVWQTHITKTEISGFTTGRLNAGLSRTVEFGVNTSNRLLPSSQDLFRLRLKVFGALDIGISVIRV